MRHAGGEVARWLLPALSLHVAVAFGAAAWSRTAASGRPAARVSAPPPEPNSELTLLEVEGAEAPQARDDAPGAAPGVRHAL
ncbi:MAG TPA: hypothetical protein VJU61_12235, partial [Polyangiaceae bacterium]|nr:hypothetical protein [Polyangiaceae bacterium]